ncbi:MAG: barstar family protein [Caldilineaceae bacterium]|nr:barstar family protein [Caldilineaceae bacterium]HRJ45479.1 barstar family protein [Caldilineaceae bacterium]
MRAKVRRFLEDVTRTGVYRIDAKDDPAEVIEAAAALGWAAFRVDGGDVPDKAAFLSRSAVAMRFPAYFGQNWDAFEEIVNDPDAMPQARGYLLLLDDFAAFARSQPGDWATARSILADAAARWGAEGRGFLVLLRKAARAAPDAEWV